MKHVFHNTYVGFCALRTIIPRKYQKIRAKRSYKRSYSNVLEENLKDLVFPTNIIGKRVYHFSNDTVKVHLYVQDNKNTTSQKKLNCLSKAISGYLKINLMVEIVSSP
uniref:40S ribosomal protein S7 n=1 Tax=Gymnochlora stellata TaxID=67809 RepID=B5A4G8_GYMST|nr:40S ribosomal protein S7 [Gymnochlora stellata]